MINLNKNDIENLLPHRDPMLLIDELHDIKKLIDKDKKIRTKKKFLNNFIKKLYQG